MLFIEDLYGLIARIMHDNKEHDDISSIIRSTFKFPLFSKETGIQFWFEIDKEDEDHYTFIFTGYSFNNELGRFKLPKPIIDNSIFKNLQYEKYFCLFCSSNTNFISHAWHVRKHNYIIDFISSDGYDWRSYTIFDTL